MWRDARYAFAYSCAPRKCSDTYGWSPTTQLSRNRRDVEQLSGLQLDDPPVIERIKTAR
jgi:hypothetical protein